MEAVTRFGSVVTLTLVAWIGLVGWFMNTGMDW